MKIFPKMLLGSLTISLIPFTFLAFGIVRATSETLLQEEAQNLREIGNARIKALSEFFSVKEKEAALIGHSDHILNLIPRLEESLKEGAISPAYSHIKEEADVTLEYFNKVYNVASFSLISKEGKLLFSQEIDGLPIGSSLREEKGSVASIFSNVETMLEPMISNLKRDPLNNKMRILIGAPLFKDNKYVGAVIAQISSEKVYGFFQDYSGLGKTGEILLGFREGDYIHFAIPTRHLAKEFFTIEIGEDKALPMQNAVLGKKGEGQSIDYRGEEIIAVWDYFPYLDVGVVVKKDLEEAAAVSYELRIYIFTIAFMIITILSFLTYILSKTLTSPIAELEKTMKRVSQGDLSHPKEIKSKDELGSLSHSFNEMITQLYDSTTSIEQLHLEVDRRKAAEKQMADFLSVMTHELRGPIAPISEGINIVLQGEIPPEQKKYLTIAAANAKRLHLIANDLLDYRKLEAGKMQYTMKEYDLNAIIEECSQMLSPTIEEKELKLTLALDKGLPKISCDHDRIVQVVVNLLTNALKFTEEGGITLRSRKQGDFIEIEIADTGYGISQEDFGKLFQGFCQLERKEGKKIPGTGLGLFICKEIIEQHKGKIWIESIRGTGTSFFFTLPI